MLIWKFVAKSTRHKKHWMSLLLPSFQFSFIHNDISRCDRKIKLLYIFFLLLYYILLLNPPLFHNTVIIIIKAIFLLYILQESSFFRWNFHAFHRSTLQTMARIRFISFMIFLLQRLLCKKNICCKVSLALD
jgi:hypothetical protein